MKARIVRIGNSRGIRISKPLIEQVGLGDEAEMAVRGNTLVIRAIERPRVGWGEAFREMAARGDDGMPDEARPTRWDAASSSPLNGRCPASFSRARRRRLTQPRGPAYPPPFAIAPYCPGRGAAR